MTPLICVSFLDINLVKVLRICFYGLLCPHIPAGAALDGYLIL